MAGSASEFGACVINLDASHDRRKTMEAEFASAGLRWRRVPGVLPTAMPDHLKAFFDDASGRPVTSLTPGETGCFAAHLSIMARMADGEFEPVMLVVEDDCTLSSGLHDQMQTLLRRLPADWDMVRLCNVPKRAYVELDRLPSGHAIVRYSTIPNFTGAYLVSVAGARKLLASGPKTIPFDGFLREAWRHDCNIFGIWPPMVVQRDDDSCIDRIDDLLRADRAGRGARVDRVSTGRRLAWQIGALGFPAWLACQVVDAGDALLRRCSGRTVIHRAAPWLGRLSVRRRQTGPAADVRIPLTLRRGARLDAAEI